MPDPNEEVVPEKGTVEFALPVNLKWMPRYGEKTLKTAPWLILIAAGVALAGVVILYYRRSGSTYPTVTPSPSPSAVATQVAGESALGAGEVARAATDFAVVLLVAGVAIVLIGVVLVLGEVLKAEDKQAEGSLRADAAGTRSFAATDMANLVSKTVEALVNAAKGLSVGRLVIIVGVVPIALSAWVAQSATTVTLTDPDPAPVVSETPAPPPDDPSGDPPTDDPSAAPSDTGAATSPEPTDITTP